MRIQILKHDDEEYTANLDLWAQEHGFELAVANIELGEAFPAGDAFDWLVLYGGDQHVYDEVKWPWLVEEKRLVRDSLEAGKVVIGFCLGAQVLAAVMGGENYALEHQEYGVRSISHSEEGKGHPLLQGISDPFVSFQMHGDHFSLPEGCLRLAENDASANQMFVLPDGRGKGVGYQFHPEYSKDFLRYLVGSYPDFWPQGPFVPDPKTLLAGVDELQDTYPLFKQLMDNVLNFWGEGNAA
jgi:GMP synthase-like glutamine amidotransferase